MFELYLLRPDAVKALEDPKIRRILPRYIRIVNAQTVAKFQVAKRIEFKPTKTDLWKVHTRLMKKFYETLKKLDKNQLKLDDLKKPKSSLLDLKIKLTEQIMTSCEL